MAATCDGVTAEGTRCETLLATSRPAPLQLNKVLKPKAKQLTSRQLPLPDWASDSEVPVRWTFIDYRCPDESPRPLLSRSHSGLSTAPASLAGSVRESLGSREEVTLNLDRSPRCSSSVEASGLSSSSSTSSTAPSPEEMYQSCDRSSRVRGFVWSDCSDESIVADHKVSKNSGASQEATSGGSTEDEAGESSGDEDDDDDNGVCPVYSEGADLPSIGSQGHGDGTCRRCCFFPKGRCNNGQDCQFCHFAHEKRKTKSKKKKHKKRRGRGKQAAASAEAAASADSSPEGSATGSRPVEIVLQTAIPEEGSITQPTFECVAFVPVPFVQCVGVY
eukprot:TRINITY_DN82029_c0_g1_i1.p1 TRINITY_DN82029_c0_g1~~TRINITY_DN82029_c0_g1_i1.p1  ORF type:complete len:333 (-),score=62.51 TRINITY_DN82029_c0_g1_i1:188-1186(-)